MNETERDQLDELLQQWAARHTPPEAELNQLQQRIRNALHTTASDENPPAAARRRADGAPAARPRGAAACGFVLGAAAAALVALAAGWLVPDARDANATADLPPQFTWLLDGHLREKSQLLSEMDAVFDRQVAWLLETGARVKIGVAERARASSAKAVAVRIVVQRRRPGESDWSLLWAADVVARNEEVVRLEPDAPDVNRLVLWAYALPDGMIAVDSEITLQTDAAVTLSGDQLQMDRQPALIMSTEAQGDEFRLFQTAAVLDDDLT